MPMSAAEHEEGITRHYKNDFIGAWDDIPWMHGVM